MGWFMDIMRKAMGHLSEEELIGVALEGLSGPEKDRAEAHLRACAMCRRALRDWLALHDTLAFLVPLQPEPSGLSNRIVLNAFSEPQATSEQP
jgi:hypothetical protein